jgi:hypothetical protein
MLLGIPEPCVESTQGSLTFVDFVALCNKVVDVNKDRRYFIRDSSGTDSQDSPTGKNGCQKYSIWLEQDGQPLLKSVKISNWEAEAGRQLDREVQEGIFLLQEHEAARRIFELAKNFLERRKSLCQCA